MEPPWFPVAPKMVRRRLEDTVESGLDVVVCEGDWFVESGEGSTVWSGDQRDTFLLVFIPTPPALWNILFAFGSLMYRPNHRLANHGARKLRPAKVEA